MTERLMGYLRGLADLPKNPPVTTIAVFLCATAFALVNLKKSDGFPQALELAGWRNAVDIWDGQWWALITSAFVHSELWHVAFNLYWLWVLGGRLELQLGAFRYLAFSLAAAFVTSAMQLAVSSQTGIGYSGVGYAIFGLMWQTRSAYPEFQRALDPKTCQLFLLWLFGCLIMSSAGGVSIGNTAHFSGLAFGCMAAPVMLGTSRKVIGMTGIVLSLAASVVALCWAPWDAYWLANKGYHAHVEGDYARAIKFYDAAIERDPGIDLLTNRDQAAEALKESP